MEKPTPQSSPHLVIKEHRVVLGMMMVGIGFLIPYVVALALWLVSGDWGRKVQNISDVVGALLLATGFTVAALQMNHLALKLALILIPLLYLIITLF